MKPLHFPSQQYEWTGHKYSKPERDYAAMWQKFREDWAAEDERRAAMGPGTQAVPTRQVETYFENQLNENETA